MVPADVEIKVNRDSKGKNERGPSLVGLSCRYKRFLFSLGCFNRPNKCFPTVHYFNSFVPIAHQAGKTAVLGCLSFSMCLWKRHFVQLHSLILLCYSTLYCHSLLYIPKGNTCCWDRFFVVVVFIILYHFRDIFIKCRRKNGRFGQYTNQRSGHKLSSRKNVQDIVNSGSDASRAFCIRIFS